MDDTFELVGATFLVMILGFLAILGGVYTYKSMVADGKVAYCYTNYGGPTYDLVGHREWRPDILIARGLPSLEELKRAAATYGCELK